MPDNDGLAKNRQEMLRRLLDIEREAADITRDADERAQKVISDAKQSAGGVLGGSRSGAQKKAESLIQEANTEADEQADRLLDETDAEIEAWRKQFEKNMNKAVSRLVDWVTAKQ